MRPTFLGTPAWRLNPVLVASEFRHVAASGPGRFQRDRSGNADIQGVKIDKQKADLLENALKTRGIADQKAFSERLRRHGAVLEDKERDLLINLATNWFETTADQEFEAIAANSLDLLGNRASRNIAPAPARQDTPGAHQPDGPVVGGPMKSETRSDVTAQPALPDFDRLQAELDAASRNRRAAVERAARKEAEFNAARNTANNAWSRVGKEAAKAAIQLGATLVTKRGRPASPGLGAAYETYEAAMSAADEKQKELQSLRREIADWDAEINAILSHMPK